jgi:hypothetical protein
MKQVPFVNSLAQPMTQQDLHNLIRQLASKQTLAERMMVTSRHGGWHLAFSLLKKEYETEPRSVIRRMAEYVVESLHRNKQDDEDTGSFLMEDLSIQGPGSTDPQDVVVSWGQKPEDLEKEVLSIRRCLDTLGIFDTQGTRDFGVHADTGETPVGQVSFRYENATHEVRTSAHLRLQSIMAALGHVLPGMGKAEIGGHVNFRIPFQDSREKFIAALLALQLQSNGQLVGCSDLCRERDKLSKIGEPADLQKKWEQIVVPGQTYLKNVLAALDDQMRTAFDAHPSSRGRSLMYYEQCLSALEHGNLEFAVARLDNVRRLALPVQKAMGENYYLFAANVIMQGQLQMLGTDIDKTLQDRFGVSLLDVRSRAPQNAPDDPLPVSPTPPPFLRKGRHP